MNPTYLNTLQTSLHVTTLMDIWDIHTWICQAPKNIFLFMQMGFQLRHVHNAYA